MMARDMSKSDITSANQKLYSKTMRDLGQVRKEIQKLKEKEYDLLEQLQLVYAMEKLNV
jgi:hypothetical protein